MYVLYYRAKMRHEKAIIFFVASQNANIESSIHKEIKSTLIQISVFLLLYVCLCGVCTFVFMFLNRCQFGNQKVICSGQFFFLPLAKE